MTTRVLTDNKGDLSAHKKDYASVFDVAVIGGGPGGYVCAIRCAQRGLKTALVEYKDLGGTCLNRGCIPTKSLLHSAELYGEIKNHGAELGITADNIAVDFAAMMKRKDNIVKKIRNGIDGLIKKNKIDLITGYANLTGKNTFTADKKEYYADNIVIATGCEAWIPPIPGVENEGVLNSDEFLVLQVLPKSVVIIGGGVIGIEFATLLSEIGCDVTVIEALPRILSELDGQISETLTKTLAKKGVNIITSARVQEIRDGLVCIYEKGDVVCSVPCEKVVVAVGRKPNTSDIGFEKAGIAMNRGFISVKETMQTNISSIYAVGDITGEVQLAHVASAQGIVAAENIAGKKTKMRYGTVPSCVYTNPEIACVGRTEEQLKKENIRYKVGTFPTAANGRSIIKNSTYGFAKILVCEKTDEIFGAHIMAPNATDMIAEIAVAMNLESTLEELSCTIHPHPSVCEMIMEAGHDVHGESCHK